MITLGRIAGISIRLSTMNSPATRYATAVSDDSMRRIRPSAARNSSLSNPWLFSATASGGPEIVVTE